MKNETEPQRGCKEASWVRNKQRANEYPPPLLTQKLDRKC